MKRLVWLLGAVALTACGFACSLCQSPFDYAGPVVGPGNEPLHGFHDREGSSLAGAASNVSGGAIQEDGVAVESAQRPTAGGQRTK